MTSHHLPVTLIGGPTVLLEYAGLTLLTDPTFDSPGDRSAAPGQPRKLRGPAIQLEALPTVDAVLLSHDTHIDNLDVAGRRLVEAMPVTISTPAARANIPHVTALTPWQPMSLPSPLGVGVRLTAVPALHGPPEVEHLIGEVTGFVLEADGWPTVYISGDNASLDVVGQIAERFPRIEVAILFLGAAQVAFVSSQNLTLDARGAVEAARLLTGAVIVPVHAEGWSHYTESRSAIEPAFRAAGLEDRLHLLPVGERVSAGV